MDNAEASNQVSQQADELDNAIKGGKKRFWKKFTSTDSGKRIAAEGEAKRTFVSPFVAEEKCLKAWAARMQELGFDLSKDELLDQFVLELESVVHDLDAQKVDMQKCLTLEELKHLKECRKRLASLHSWRNQYYSKHRLAKVCNLVARHLGNVVPYSEEENNLCLKLSWQA